MVDIYQNFRNACARRGKTITRVLNDIGKSDGSTGSWKAGKFPRLDTVMEIADVLDMSLDELCYGPERMRASILSRSDLEWLSLLHRVPEDKRELCRDLIATHIAEPEKYVDGKMA